MQHPSAGPTASVPRAPEGDAAGVLEGLRVFIVAAERQRGDTLAGHLVARGARVLLSDRAKPDLEVAAELDPEVVIIEPTTRAQEGLAIARAMHSHRRLRWASILRSPWSRFWDSSAAEPDLSKLERLLRPLVEQERALRGRVGREDRFVTELDRIGPNRTLRILVEAGGAFQIQAQSPEARVQLEVVDGRVIRAEARLPPRSIIGEAALELYYGLRSGPLEVHRITAEGDPQADVVTAPWTPPSHLVDAAADAQTEDQRATRKLRPLRVRWSEQEADSTPRRGSRGVPSSAFVLPDLFDADMVDTLRKDEALAAPQQPHGPGRWRAGEREEPPAHEAPIARVVRTPLPPSPPEERGPQAPILIPGIARLGPSRASAPAQFPVVAEDQAARVTGATPIGPGSTVFVGVGAAFILAMGVAVALAVGMSWSPSFPLEAVRLPPSSPAAPEDPHADAVPARGGSSSAPTPAAAPGSSTGQTAVEPWEAVRAATTEGGDSPGVAAPGPDPGTREGSAAREPSPPPPEDARALVREARRLPLPRSAAAAEVLYRRALELQPYDPRAMAGLAEVFLRTGERQAAVTWAERAVDAAPRRASYWVLWGDGLERQGRTDEARAQWREALRLSPHNRAIRIRLGQRGD